MASTWMRIEGVPATEIAPPSAPTFSFGADGGCLEASFAFSLSARSQHQVLRPGSYVEILAGLVPLWTGILAEPDRSTWECHAYGLAASLRGYLALTSGGASTRDLGQAITEAAVRGWRGSNAAAVVGTATGDATGNPVTVGTLLDDYAEQTGQRWGTNGRGVLYMRPDPTIPTMTTSPGAAAFSPTDEGAQKRLAGRYFNGTIDATAFAGTGAPEEDVDLTDRGTLTQAEAEAILAGILARRKGTSWTGSATLHREQFMTMGGQALNLSGNHTGQLLRVQGLSESVVSASPWIDVVVGKSTYTAGSEFITIEPVNSAPRGLADVIAAA